MCHEFWLQRTWFADSKSEVRSASNFPNIRFSEWEFMIKQLFWIENLVMNENLNGCDTIWRNSLSFWKFDIWNVFRNTLSSFRRIQSHLQFFNFYLDCFLLFLERKFIIFWIKLKENAAIIDTKLVYIVFLFSNSILF